MTSGIELPKLPYSFDALEPIIKASSLKVHYLCHHQAYVNKLKDAISSSTFASMSIESIITAVDANTPRMIRNNSGGHYNHSLFWLCMQPMREGIVPAVPSGKFQQAVINSFGSEEALKRKIKETALDVFGSGWVWITASPQSPDIKVQKSANQDTTLMTDSDMNGQIPFFGLDVWEHAYYLDYQHERGLYVDQWFNIINWDFVAQAYEKYALAGLPVKVTDELKK